MHWLLSARACGQNNLLHQQNPPVLNWKNRLMQVGLNSGRKTVVVVAVYMIYMTEHGLENLRSWL